MTRATTLGLAAAALLAGCVPWADEDLTALRTGVQWHMVSASNYRNCALDGGGQAYCWGAMPLGSISPADQCYSPPNPVDPINDPGGYFPCGKRPMVVYGDQRYSAMSSYGMWTAAIDQQGDIWAWGDNSYGLRYAPGDTSLGEYPRRVADLSAWHFAQVVVGPATCGLTTDGKAVCWGLKNMITSNVIGLTGASCQPQIGQNGVCVAPAEIGTPGTPGATWAQLALGMQHVCGLDNGGTVWCKGEGDGGMLGSTAGLTQCPYPGSAFTVACRLTFAPVAGTDKYTEISAGGEITCGITTTKVLKCWGRMYQTIISATGPAIMGALGVAWSHVSVGENGFTVCATRPDGTVWCFGLYQLGGGGLTMRPVVMPGLAVNVSVGENHACAWAADGTAWCWGDELSGNLGDGTDDRAFKTVPVQVSAPYRD